MAENGWNLNVPILRESMPASGVNGHMAIIGPDGFFVVRSMLEVVKTDFLPDYVLSPLISSFGFGGQKLGNNR